MATDAVFFDEVTGYPSAAATTLRRKLSAYTRTHLVSNFKIGITNDPYRRFREAYARDYDEMIVLYRSSSLAFVSQAECDLIEHNAALTANRIAGGGGNYGRAPYYLYIVIRKAGL